MKRILEAELQEVEIIGENTLLIYSHKAQINKIMIKEKENFAVDFKFKIAEIEQGEDVILDLVQQNYETKEFEGGERFIIRSTEKNAPQTKIASFNEKFAFAYPNPTNGNVNVDYKVTDPNSAVEIRINSLRGDLVKQIDLGKLSKGNFTENIDVSTLATGVYFVRLQVGDEIQTQKIVVGMDKE